MTDWCADGHWSAKKREENKSDWWRSKNATRRERRSLCAPQFEKHSNLWTIWVKGWASCWRQEANWRASEELCLYVWVCVWVSELARGQAKIVRPLLCDRATLPSSFLSQFQIFYSLLSCNLYCTGTQLGSDSDALAEKSRALKRANRWGSFQIRQSGGVEPILLFFFAENTSPVEQRREGKRSVSPTAGTIITWTSCQLYSTVEWMNEWSFALDHSDSRDDDDVTVMPTSISTFTFAFTSFASLIDRQVSANMPKEYVQRKL